MSALIIKVFIIIVLVILTIFLLFFSYLWWTSLKQPPAHALIIEKYYVCREHKILQGGIFGKGPIRKFTKADSKTWCWRNDWEEIDRKTFKNLATEWYGINWAEEPPYWSRN